MNDKFEIKALVERDEKGLRAVASTAMLDRQGDVVEQEGWDLKNFKKNPVLLWAHDTTEPAIGTAKNIKVEGEGKKMSLTFEPVFHDVTEKARAIAKLFADGILNSFSVGFMPIEKDGNNISKSELYEISAVNVPANPEARMSAYKSLAGFSNDTITDLGLGSAALAKMQEQIDKLNNDYKTVVKGLTHLNPSGRDKSVVTNRLSMLKVIARASDRVLEKEQPKHTADLVKVIKRANEDLIVDHKQELKINGTNKRLTG